MGRGIVVIFAALLCQLASWSDATTGFSPQASPAAGHGIGAPAFVCCFLHERGGGGHGGGPARNHQQRVGRGCLPSAINIIDNRRGDSAALLGCLPQLNRRARDTRTMMSTAAAAADILLANAEANGCTRPGTNILDGKLIAQAVREEVKRDCSKFEEKYGMRPGLAVIIVGERKDSQTYVRNKEKTCSECGIESTKIELPDSIGEDELLGHVQRLNADPAVHGILVQLPLPSHINEQKIVGAVVAHKDVDGFHPENIGALALNGRTPAAPPCTPSGVMEILRRAGVPLRGKRALVIGRSNIVGMPMSLMLTRADATVQVATSHTPSDQLEEALKASDIVVASAGSPGLVKGEWVKEGATVVDVGINAVDDASKKAGYRLVGDVAFEQAKERAGLITPVPGGVGPMTIAMLMRNTINVARLQMEARRAEAA